jgi:hypothetical protein
MLRKEAVQITQVSFHGVLAKKPSPNDVMRVPIWCLDLPKPAKPGVH